MKANLQKLCDDFIVNRDAVQKAFAWDLSYVYPVCANVFCSRGRVTSAEQLKQSRRVIEANTGLFSNFRGNIRPILASMLALGEDPDAQMALAKEYYARLKQEFMGSEYLALAAFLLTDMADSAVFEEKAERGKRLYKRMQKEHPFLTGSEDSVFAVLLAFSERSDDELIADMESCYTALKERFSVLSDLQSVSQVLSLTEGRPQEKAERVIELYNALRDAGVKYGRGCELSTLAALSLTGAPIASLTEDIKDVYDFLKTQKGYGLLGFDAQQRAMHAAMIVSDQYGAQDRVNTAAMTGTLAMIVAMEISLCMIAVSSASSSASASSGR